MAPQSWRIHFRSLTKLGLPLVASSLAGFAIHLTDTVMLGWYDVFDLAAVTLAGSVNFLVWVLGAGFAMGLSSLVASAEGRGDVTESRRLTRMALWISAGYAVLMVPVYLLPGPLFDLLGQDADVSVRAAIYLGLIWFNLIPSLAITVLRNYLSAVERTGVILRSTIAATVFNIGLNWVLIFGRYGAPELGIRGAAVASVLSMLFALGWLVVYIRVRLPEQQLFRRLWRPDIWAARRVFTLGLPIGLTALAEGGMFAVSSIMVGWLGPIQLAAHGIALQIVSLFFMGQVGLSQAVTVRVGRFHGQHNAPDLRRSALAALGLSGGMVALTTILLLAAPLTLVNLFIDPAEPARAQIETLGVQLLAVAALFQLADAGQIITQAMLRGVQDTRVPMMLAIVCYWALGIGSSYLLSQVWDFGAVGVWLGLTLGLSAAAMAMSVRFWAGQRRGASAV